MLDITYDTFYCATCFRSLAVRRPYEMEELPACEGCDTHTWVLNPLKRIDDTWTQGTHIVFRNLGKMNGSTGPQRKTNIYEVCTRSKLNPDIGFQRLGEIRWFGRWRKYSFYPLPDTIYEETCMREISLFIQQETRLHNKKRKAAKA
jgi:hypothetical protein